MFFFFFFLERGSCTKCGGSGHLSFQCRNFLKVNDVFFFFHSLFNQSVLFFASLFLTLFPFFFFFSIMIG